MALYFNGKRIGDKWPCQIDGEIDCPDVTMGQGVVIEAGVVIKADKVVLGDFCFIGRDTVILVPEFRLGGLHETERLFGAAGNEADADWAELLDWREGRTGQPRRVGY